MSPCFHSNLLSHSACHRCATSYKLQGWLETSTCPLSENDFTFSLLPRHKSSKTEQQIEMQNSAVKPYLGESLFGLFSVAEHLISFFCFVRVALAIKDLIGCLITIFHWKAKIYDCTQPWMRTKTLCSCAHTQAFTSTQQATGSRCFHMPGGRNRGRGGRR